MDASSRAGQRHRPASSKALIWTARILAGLGLLVAVFFTAGAVLSPVTHWWHVLIGVVVYAFAATLLWALIAGMVLIARRI